MNPVDSNKEKLSSFPEKSNTERQLDVSQSTFKKDEEIFFLSVPLATFYMTKASVGVGVLFLPACMVKLGLGLGIIIIFLGSLVNTLSMYWISEHVKTRQQVEQDQSQSLSKVLSLISSNHWIKSFVVLVVELVGVVMCLSTLVVYERLVQTNLVELALISTLTKPLSQNFFAKWPMLILIGIACTPFALVKDARKISWISFGGLIGMLYLILIILCDCLFLRPVQRVEWQWWPSQWSVDLLAPTANIMYAFSCQYWIPLLMERVRPGSDRPKTIISGSTLITLIYMLVAVGGYLAYGQGLGEDAVLHAHHDLTMIIAQIILTPVYVMSFPLLLAPVRQIINDKLFDSITPTTTINEWCLKNILILVGESVGLVTLVTVLAILIPGATLRIADTVGALGNAPVALCLPALLTVKHYSTWPRRVLHYALAGFCILVGLALWTGGLYKLFIF